jgi:hypothetical protein
MSHLPMLAAGPQRLTFTESGLHAWLIAAKHRPSFGNKAISAVGKMVCSIPPSTLAATYRDTIIFSQHIKHQQ